MNGLNGWASPDGSAGDVFWRRPAGSANSAPPPGRAPAAPAQYAGPPRMHRPAEAVGWGPVIVPGPVARSLPEQDHEALDREDAQARAVTVGVGVLTLVVLFLLLLMMVIRAGTAAGAGI
ncbi:translation initiation factor 2 [Cryptosporangium japonicum]|uniref:Uncharacterized protein n=1 Tax=Cryptosporangium japonicum TaxID=80872 RepID=A0ABN0VAV3_9ACTN